LPVTISKIDLSEAEKEFLARFNRTAKRMYINYISTGLTLSVAIVGFIFAVALGRNEGFMIAIVFGAIALNLFVMSHSHQKLHAIITKMTKYIEELERGESH